MSTNENPNKIVITTGDTEDARTVSVSQQMKKAEEYATVREVGDFTSANRGGVTLIAVLIMAGSGILGGIVAFALNKFSDVLVNWENQSAWVGNLTFTFLMAFAIGLTILAIDSATQRNAKKLGTSLGIGAPVAIAAGLMVGGIAHLIYSPWTTSIYEQAQNQVQLGIIVSEAQYIDFVTGKLHWARGVAWSIVGIAAGLTIGIASKSARRLLVTTLGGFVGGFFGGFIFDFFSGESSAQIFGMIVTGLLIGLSMALIEQAAKSRWIEIVTGGMAGKQFILYKTDLTIGSSPRADITLIKDPAIPELAARLTIQGNQAILESLNPSLPVSVNNQVATRTVLTDGAQLTFGSSIVRYREKSADKSAPAGGPIRLS
jgi:hypothetical protein